MANYESADHAKLVQNLAETLGYDTVEVACDPDGFEGKEKSRREKRMGRKSTNFIISRRRVYLIFKNTSSFN